MTLTLYSLLVRNSAIIPWIAFFFVSIQTVISFIASRSVADAEPYSPQSTHSLEKKEMSEA